MGNWGLEHLKCVEKYLTTRFSMFYISCGPRPKLTAYTKVSSLNWPRADRSTVKHVKPIPYKHKTLNQHY